MIDEKTFLYAKAFGTLRAAIAVTMEASANAQVAGSLDVPGWRSAHRTIARCLRDMEKVAQRQGTRKVTVEVNEASQT